MNNRLPIVACLGLACFNLQRAGAVPVLTLTEIDDTHLDWSWSDGTGSGTFVTAVPDWWNGYTIPMPTGIGEDFYGRWEEDFPGHRNDVYLKVTAGGPGTLYVTSDLVDFSPSLAPLGSALDSYNSGYQIVFNDKGDHIVTNVPEQGVGVGMLAGVAGAILLARRRVIRQ